MVTLTVYVCLAPTLPNHARTHDVDKKPGSSSIFNFFPLIAYPQGLKKPKQTKPKKITPLLPLKKKKTNRTQ